MLHTWFGMLCNWSSRLPQLAAAKQPQQLWFNPSGQLWLSKWHPLLASDINRLSLLFYVSDKNFVNDSYGDRHFLVNNKIPFVTRNTAVKGKVLVWSLVRGVVTVVASSNQSIKSATSWKWIKLVNSKLQLFQPSSSSSNFPHVRFRSMTFSWATLVSLVTERILSLTKKGLLLLLTDT